ncbi:MAG: GPR endopeptidase [Firmicutes bacterium]|nr:GPR endopeptidase [Bacillota bacterium]
MSSNIRTDLALEATELWREGVPAGADSISAPIPGVESGEEQRGKFRVTTVKVLDERGEQALNKPRGSYVTVELDALIRREENAFPDAVALVSEKLRELMKMVKSDSCLVAGLGNEAITPDAIGPQTIKSVLVTRHLKQTMAKEFEFFREVSATRSGVLGTTGVESAELIDALARMLRPSQIIAIDALASRKAERLCRTVQMTDTGIVPGSGVGNHRAALNSATLGVPVIAIGVPTVVDAATLAVELARQAGVGDLGETDFGEAGRMIVTPRDIDSSVHDIAKLVGYAIDVALHDGLTIEDIDMFL